MPLVRAKNAARQRIVGTDDAFRGHGEQDSAVGRELQQLGLLDVKPEPLLPGGCFPHGQECLGQNLPEVEQHLVEECRMQ